MVGVTAPQGRRLLLVSGEAAWCERWVSRQLADDQRDAVLWIARHAPRGIAATPAGRVTQRLGSECRLLVFNAHDGFHPDAFAAAVGTLRGGGDCVLLAPPLAAWAGFADPDKARFAAYPREPAQMQGHFLARLARLWPDHPATRVVTPETEDASSVRLAPQGAADLQLTEEQQAAVAAVERVAHGHARRPLVLSADRGRGKSTLLGVAAARLLRAGLARITVVAPHRAAAETLFRQALAAAGLPEHGVADIRIGGGELRFRLPAECVADAETPGLVLVDEAAAIPVAVLRRLLERSNRLVFASTVHGYEGTGRGFELRFKGLLDREMPQWRPLQLSTPVRWAADDPLEDLLNGSFALDAELNVVVGGADLSIVRIGPAALAEDEVLLRSTFGLLINAHYQTRPSDLRQLLDNPDTHLWLALQGSAVVGVLLISLEGGLDQAIARQVLRGARRPRGHLLPQSLAVHAGLESCLQQRVIRVQRIAVHPQRQRHGVASRLLQRLCDWGAEHGVDLLGCAFGAELSLLEFWRANGFVPVRLGVRVDPASAAHSLFMLHGLSMQGRALAEDGLRRFIADLPWSLGLALRDLDSHLACALLQGRDCSDLVLDDGDWHALGRVADGTRQPATADALIWRVLVRIAAQTGDSGADLAPLIAGWLQHRDSGQLCRDFSICGRRALNARLRSLLARQQKALSDSG